MDKYRIKWQETQISNLWHGTSRIKQYLGYKEDTEFLCLSQHGDRRLTRHFTPRHSPVIAYVRLMRGLIHSVTGHMNAANILASSSLTSCLLVAEPTTTTASHAEIIPPFTSTFPDLIGALYLPSLALRHTHSRYFP
jgi:hypothetical protein